LYKQYRRIEMLIDELVKGCKLDEILRR